MSPRNPGVRHTDPPTRDGAPAWVTWAIIAGTIFMVFFVGLMFIIASV